MSVKARNGRCLRAMCRVVAAVIISSVLLSCGKERKTETETKTAEDAANVETAANTAEDVAYDETETQMAQDEEEYEGDDIGTPVIGTWQSDETTVTLWINGQMRVSGFGSMIEHCGCEGDFPEWEDKKNLVNYLVIDDGVTYIGGHAFSGIEYLSGVSISGSVEGIGCNAFSNSGLVSVQLPPSVSNICGNAFSGNANLISIEADEKNPHFVSVDGVLFNKDKTELVAYPAGKTASSYTIPDGVTTIANGAFDGAVNLRSVSIPNSVTDIGREAFSGSGLTSVTIPDGVTVIYYAAFSNCAALASVNIPGGVTNISAWAFANTALESVTIPAGVTDIGIAAFVGCENLSSITLLSATPPTVGRPSELGGDPEELANAQKVCLYVPQGSIDDYREAYIWKDFECIRETEIGGERGQ